MSGFTAKTKLIGVLALVAILVVMGVLNLRDRLSAPAVPTDGVYWVDTSQGLQAKNISPDSPLSLVALNKGDYLRYIFYQGKYEAIDKPETVSLYLDKVGVGGEAHYVIQHADPALQNIYKLDDSLYDDKFIVPGAPQNLGRGLYLAIIGLVYLGIGLFVLFRQDRAELTYHFMAWFLASFVVYFYSAPHLLDGFDKFVDFLDCAAFALLAPLFLHFCARFPSGRKFSGRAGAAIAALYGPAAILILLEALYRYVPKSFGPGALVTVRDWLDQSELVQYIVYFGIGSAFLVRSFIKARTPVLKQQLKWIIWGLGLSVLPFAVLYFIPRVSNIEITPLMETLAYGPLILIPLSFGYSIIRYRLMDVDVIVRRS